MNTRITFIATCNNNLEQIEYYTKQINETLCKTPFGKNIDNREEADKLPYHFTLSAWNIIDKEKVIKELSQINFPELSVMINGVDIMNGKENSYVLYFTIAKNEALSRLQEEIYQLLPNERYNPTNFTFHITIHIDKDYNKIIRMKEQILQNFIPFALTVNLFELYEIWSVTLVKQFQSTALTLNKM